MPHPPLPHRIAGDLALDFANTISWRGTDHEVDHLRDADAVLTWASAVGLSAGLGTPSPADSAQLVAAARGLRRAIDEAGSAIAAGREPPAGALAAIRDVAARSLAGAVLQGVPARLAFAGIDGILGPVAWAALDLLRGDELGRLKQCPPDDCRWLFIDRTKNGSRKWCEMAVCGDRAKKRKGRD